MYRSKVAARRGRGKVNSERTVTVQNQRCMVEAPMRNKVGKEKRKVPTLRLIVKPATEPARSGVTATRQRATNWTAWSRNNWSTPDRGPRHLTPQGDDPAVEQVQRGDPLSAQVVDHERPAVRLDVQRGFVDPARLTWGQFHRFDRQFPPRPPHP